VERAVQDVGSEGGEGGSWGEWCRKRAQMPSAPNEKFDYCISLVSVPRMPGHISRKRFADALPASDPAPADAAAALNDDVRTYTARDNEETTEDVDQAAAYPTASAAQSALADAPSDSSRSALPKHDFFHVNFVGLQCCCSLGSVPPLPNSDGIWTELLLLASDAHGRVVVDEMDHVEDKSFLTGGIQLGTFHCNSDFSPSDPSFQFFRPLFRSDDSAMTPPDLQCHAVDEAGQPLLLDDRHIRINSM
jgi:hypothetical protein